MLLWEQFWGELFEKTLSPSSYRDGYLDSSQEHKKRSIFFLHFDSPFFLW